jgi:TnpA family transposase
MTVNNSNNRNKDKENNQNSSLKEGQLLIEWSLSEIDIETIFSNCNGEQQCLCFALQLCTLRNTGQFLKDYQSVSHNITAYLATQLELNPDISFSETINEKINEKTEYKYQEKIRDYLNYSLFNEPAQQKLQEWTTKTLSKSILSHKELFQKAIKFLKKEKIIRPSKIQLGRFISSEKQKNVTSIYNQISSQLTEKQKEFMAQLIQVDKDMTYSKLNYYKRSPPDPKASDILDFIHRFEQLEEADITKLKIQNISPKIIEQLAKLTRCYEARALRRIQPEEKRHALLACFLTETSKTLLDHIIEMNEAMLQKKEQKSRCAFNKDFKRLRKKAKKSLQIVLSASRKMLNHSNPDETTLTDFYQIIGKEKTESALTACEELYEYEQNGFYDILEGKYTDLRKYTSRFFELDFLCAKGSESLYQGIQLMRQINREEIKTFPSYAPTDFMSPEWKKSRQKEGTPLTQKTWEMGLYYAVKEALKNGNLYLKGSRYHRDFWETIYSNHQWEKERVKAYGDLSLPKDPEKIIDALNEEFEKYVSLANSNLDPNSFACIDQDGTLKLRKDDALEISDSTKELREIIQSRLPFTRIEKVISDVEKMTNFSRFFTPQEGYVPTETIHPYKLHAALIAHGTNIGIQNMACSTDDVTLATLQILSQWFLRPETLEAASACLIDKHQEYPLTKLYGDGSYSSSDADRFGIQKSSILASYYPPMWGRRKRVLGIYTHISDQFSVFSTQVISCGPREAIYVLDGLLSNISTLNPRFHATDTGGYTDHLFALCYLLGFSFQPRIKDLTHKQLYKLYKNKRYGDLDRLLNKSININLVKEQWDNIVKIAASLKNRLAPAHVILERLAGRTPKDNTARALSELGKIIKTIYILRYISDEPLRRRVQLQLNRGESRHALARHLFFYDQGEFRTSDTEEILSKASSLSLLSNVVLIWNTHNMGKIVEDLRAQGYPINDADLSRVSLLMRKHLIVNGAYNFKAYL